MKQSNVKILETADGGIFIVQRPTFLAKKKRAAVEKADSKLSAEAEERRERRHHADRSAAVSVGR